MEFSARRCDRDRCSTCNHLFRCAKVSLPTYLPSMQGSTQGKLDHEIKSYVDKLIRSGDKWFADFSGMEGNGVSGTDNERRTIA